MNRGAGRMAVGSLAAVLPALLLAGCSGMAGFEGPDPLTGGPPIQRRTSPAPSLAAGLAPPSGGITPTGAAGQLPPVPTPSTATSQAALAGGLTQPLDAGRDLRIGTPTALPPDQPLWRGTDTAAPASTPPSPVRLSDPQVAGGLPAQPAPIQATQPPTQPAPSPAVPSGPAAAPTVQAISVQPPTAASGRPQTLEQAYKVLYANRTVIWKKLETLDDDSWQFRCAIADVSKPDVEHNYVAKGPTALDAFCKVLDQITLEKR